MTCAVFMLVLTPFGVFESWWGPLLAYLSQVLVGIAFATLVYGFSARLTSPEGFGVLFRLGVFPLFLFSGAFFPVSNLGAVGERLAQLTPLWHGVSLSRMFCVDVDRLVDRRDQRRGAGRDHRVRLVVVGDRA